LTTIFARRLLFYLNNFSVIYIIIDKMLI